ncbi:hypothetical protein [Methanobrevibacter sp.]|uniref:hypothetical protein n=1 Tax=Methanobrevibacter sp. TaxID=66852 RepID=UPI0039761386
MDRRWILIIIILFIGFGAMCCIVDNSDTIGSAITTFGKTTITIPDGFSVGESTGDHVELYNKKNSELITIYDFGKGNNAEEILKNVTDYELYMTDYINQTNKTIKIDDVELHESDLQSENGTTYTFSFYHDKYTYIIEMEGYKDANKINEDLKFIICTMHPDYKQAQD